MRVSDKAEMYRLLRSGRLGNTSPLWPDVASWAASPESRKYAFWGVRSLTAGGPCRLWTPTAEVARTAASFAPHAVNVSLMIDAVAACSMMADVWVGTGGLELHAYDRPAAGADWRRDMPTKGRHYTLTAAAMLLRQRLNGPSLDDLGVLLEAYPGHVVELSAYERSVGTVPGRNAVVWECRWQGDHGGGGDYERRSWGYCG